MKKKPLLHRSSGILAHISSLPSRFGIGDLGPGTMQFLDFLYSAKQTLWQILPLGPTDLVFSHSPYMSVSAIAGNPLLISPESLYEDGFLTQSDITDYPDLSIYAVEFEKVTKLKYSLLKKAFSTFNAGKNDDYLNFLETQKEWLGDYALFMSLKQFYPNKPWYTWDKNLIQRDKSTLDSFIDSNSKTIDYYYFEQYIFKKQWQTVHNYAASRNIEIFGDIPIYVSLDSADVWANQQLFQLNRYTHRPTFVAGVPPDYFSETGQKWGNPLYRWNSSDPQLHEKLLQWWSLRFSKVFEYVDIARIDHFRGFESYWAVPADEKTALNGKWQKGPGAKFFKNIAAILGDLRIVAEDLGEITEEVLALREELDFPGMKVLQFAFDGNNKNSFLPFNFEHSNFLVYTGTHDNDTTLGWYLDNRLNDQLRSYIKSIANRNINDNNEIHKDFIYLAMSSIASVSIIPLQDLLGFGSDCRMNKPGTIHDNWNWRCGPEFLTEDISNWLSEITHKFGRERSITAKELNSLPS